MNEQIHSYAISLIEETMMVRDEMSIPEMAFTEIVLDKIEPMLNCEEIIKEHCIVRKTMATLLVNCTHILLVKIMRFFIYSTRISIAGMKC